MFPLNHAYNNSIAPKFHSTSLIKQSYLQQQPNEAIPLSQYNSAWQNEPRRTKSQRTAANIHIPCRSTYIYITTPPSTRAGSSPTQTQLAVIHPGLPLMRALPNQRATPRPNTPRLSPSLSVVWKIATPKRAGWKLVRARICRGVNPPMQTYRPPRRSIREESAYGRALLSLQILSLPRELMPRRCNKMHPSGIIGLRHFARASGLIYNILGPLRGIIPRLGRAGRWMWVIGPTLHLYIQIWVMGPNRSVH